MAISRSGIMIISGVLLGALIILALGLGMSSFGSDNEIRLEFAPKPRDGTTLIHYKSSDIDGVKKWTDIIDLFLHEYKGSENVTSKLNLYNCDYRQPPPHHDKVCFVDPRELGPCGEQNLHNYRRSSPCVFFSLNKVQDWVPQTYNSTEQLPSSMPAALKSYINEQLKNDHWKAATVWLSCAGVTSADQEHIGPIQYYPQPGFPAYFFPYRNQLGYLSPLVAVYFERPSNNYLINVECRAWANNLLHDQTQHMGSVNFELMID